MGWCWRLLLCTGKFCKKNRSSKCILMKLLIFTWLPNLRYSLAISHMPIVSSEVFDIIVAANAFYFVHFFWFWSYIWTLYILISNLKQISGQVVVLQTDERRPIKRLDSNSGVSLTKLNVIINLLLTVKLFSALFNLECARIICDPSINVGMRHMIACYYLFMPLSPRNKSFITALC